MAVTVSGGNILFGGAGASSGNDNNTISNCNIGPAGANLPTKGVYFIGSSNNNPGLGNSGNSITDNNIFDFFGAATTSAGIYVTGGTPIGTFTNNRFYQTAARTQTTGAQHSAIWIENTAGNGYQVTGNTIGYSSSAGTGTYTFNGIAGSTFVPISLIVGTTNATNASSNTITAINFTGAFSGFSSTAPFRGIYIANGLAVTNSNTIGSTGATGAIVYNSTSTSGSECMGIFHLTSSAFVSNGNNIGGFNIGTSSTNQFSSFYGLRSAGSSLVTWTANNNTIGGSIADSVNATGTGTFVTAVGIFTQNPALTATGNTVSNLTNSSSNFFTGTNASVAGILVSSSAANHTISQNTIFNLRNTNATSGVSVNGLVFFSSATGTNLIARNYIYALTTPSSSASAQINGIFINGGAADYQNNMIALGGGLTNSPQINGIAETVQGTGANNIYHNSVYISGSPTTGTANSFAFQSTIFTNTRNYRNNIFYNGRSNATGKHYAIRVGGAVPNPTGLTSNNNDLYAPGTNGFVGLFNGVDRRTLADWQAATGQDANSISADPLLVSTTDLHLTAASPARNIAANVGVFFDFDRQVRPGANALFDIGADEFDGTAPPANDISATAIVAPANNSSFPAGATVPPQASFTNTGTATQTNVTVRFTITGPGGYSYSNQQIIAAIDPDQTITVTFGAAPAFTTIGTYTTTASVITPDANAANDAVTGMFTIFTPITGGSVNVGAGQTYTSLTNPGGVFDAINAGPITSNITVNIISDLMGESGAVALNQVAGSFTVTIIPKDAARTVTGTVQSSRIIALNGADEFTDSPQSGDAVQAGTYSDLRTVDGQTLGGNVTILDVLTLNGNLHAGANTLTFDCAATYTLAGGDFNFVEGNVRRNYCAAPSTFTYPVGTTDGDHDGYSPVTATITGGTFTAPAALTVDAVDAPLPGVTASTAASRYWTLTEAGEITADLSFQYREADTADPAVDTDEDAYRVFKRVGTTTSAQCAAPCVNTTSNIAGPVAGVSSFSNWGIAADLAPTSASVEVGGRVRETNGRGISRARVTMIDSQGETRTAFTTQFGYYRFADVPAGATYIFSVTHLRHQFADPTQIRSINEDTPDINFTAISPNE